MFNPVTSWQFDAEYRILLSHSKTRLSSDQRMRLRQYDSIMKKMESLRLDPALDIILPLYSLAGRPAKNQAQIIRSMVLFTFLLGKTAASYSLTAWVRNVLPNDPLLSALVGCGSPADLPPLGSYYDFMHRLWGASRDAYTRDALLPKGKNGKKPKKEIGEDGKLKESESESPSTVTLKNKIVAGEALSQNPESRLQDFFYLVSILPSIESGLIQSAGLTVSGDGTAVAVHASPFGTKPKGDTDKAEVSRHYSDPEAEWGWDSHEKNWYFGRTLYMLCARNASYKAEVPLLLKFLSARRHDSICFFHAVDEMGRHVPGISPSNICLDSAHDNIATYELLKRWGINALIDINPRNKACNGVPEDISIDKYGHPHCMEGHEMCSWGYDGQKEAQKYRCPLACGRVDAFKCKETCSPSKYGRTLYLKTNADLRYFPSIPRDSKQFKDIYAERTACERINNRVLNDYHLLSLKIRGDCHFSFWTMLIGICIHLDAREKDGIL